LTKFKIPSIPPTTNKTVRFPNDLIEKVETLIKSRNCTFSAFVVAAVRAAVDMDTADYKEMYYELMSATEEAINMLIEAQQKCEDIYVETTYSPDTGDGDV